MAWRTVLFLALLSATIPYLYDLSRVVRLLVFNKPENLSTVSNFTSHQVLFADKLRNCEDIILEPEAGIALLSCNPGRDTHNTVMGFYRDDLGHGSLYVYNYRDNPEEEPSLIDLVGLPKKLHPLGLAYHSESKTLVVANHGGEVASVDVFELDMQERRATFKRSIIDSNLPTPNSLAFINSTHLHATNTHQFATFTKPKSLYAKLRTWVATFEQRLALPTGSVVLINLVNDQVSTLVRIPYANGIERLEDGRTLAVASTSRAVVNLYSIDEDSAQLSYLRRVKVPFHPDNLSADSKGRLLIAGHPHAKSIGIMAKTNWQCQGGASLKTECFRAPSWVMEWDPSAGSEGELRTLYAGSWFASSSTGVTDAEHKILIITGLYEKGILVAHY